MTETGLLDDNGIGETERRLTTSIHDDAILIEDG